MDQFQAPLEPNHPGAINPGAQQPGRPLLPPSGAPKTFGVLSIIFASLILLLNLPMTCAGFAGSSMTQMGSQMSQFMPPSEDVPAYVLSEMMDVVGTLYSVMGFMALIFIAMSGWLLAIGIGQVRYRRWAADHSVYWGVGGILALVVMIGILLIYIGPAYQEMFDVLTQADADLAAISGMFGSIGSMLSGWAGVSMCIFYLPYPILMLAFFRKDNVRAAMVN